ncbi:MAG: ABC transporter ATP-binding protein [Verrucomicrobiota bacterium]
MAFLELQNVSKGYGLGAKRAEVLRDINLSISEGEFVAIVGYSGAGKTTLMSLIAGLSQPDEGQVTLRGEPVLEPSPDRAIVFQNYSLLPWLSVFENIALAVDEVFHTWPTEKRREHVEKYIAMVNLTPARDKKPRELSGGMRQRVSVARALAMDPRILLLDEPLSALDALTRAVLQDEIARIWSEARKTVVLITNDVDEGILLADRIIPLSAGPGATLGPSVNVDIERPRDRKALNHDPRFKAIRRDVIGYLLGSGGKPKASVARRLTLPDIEPEDLSVRRPLIGRSRPRRASEEKRETVEVI